MSTRAHIAFYESKEKDLNKWNVLLYRHSNGYPGTANRLKYGVLADIVPFLRWWNEDRGIDDWEYCSARLLQYLCNKYDKHTREFEVSYDDIVITEEPEFTGILGYGICDDFHDDIEYFYAIYPDKLKVYEVPYDSNCDTWKLLRTIKLVAKKT